MVSESWSVVVEVPPPVQGHRTGVADDDACQLERIVAVSQGPDA